MNNNDVHRLWKHNAENTAAERAMPVDELTEIINTFDDMIDWLQDLIGNVKELIKNKAKKFKKNIRKLKDINGPVIPVRHQ
jgi:hypothetical protein